MKLCTTIIHVNVSVLNRTWCAYLPPAAAAVAATGAGTSATEYPAAWRPVPGIGKVRKSGGVNFSFNNSLYTSCGDVEFQAHNPGRLDSSDFTALALSDETGVEKLQMERKPNYYTSNHCQNLHSLAT